MDAFTLLVVVIFSMSLGAKVGEHRALEDKKPIVKVEKEK